MRSHGDTKTRKSRHTLALSGLCVDALRAQRVQQVKDRLGAGEQWRESGLVFATQVGTVMDAANVRRGLRRALRLVPGLDPASWTPRELRNSFVSLLSDAGVSLEEIARLVGHSGTNVTELVYRHQIRPVIETGATIMDRLFGKGPLGCVVTQIVTQRARRLPYGDGRSAADQGLLLVGVTGFEPATSSSRTKRATKLRHTPWHEPRRV